MTDDKQKSFDELVEDAAFKNARYYCSTGRNNLDTAIKEFLQLGFEDGAKFVLSNLDKISEVQELVSCLEKYAEMVTWSFHPDVFDEGNDLALDAIEALKKFKNRGKGE